MDISTHKSRLNLEYIVNYLSKQSYWAKGRSKERILKSIDGSLCFGVYLNEKQIGFARIVTDYAVFAWVMDVFIDPHEQGNGHGKKLIQAITDHPDLQTISRWGLNTLDAQDLYKQYGFETIENPEIYMEKLIKRE